MEMIKVLVTNVKGKTLIQDGKGKVYIIPAMGYFLNQEIKVDLSKAIEVPSLLYGIALMYDENTEDAIKFIKENW